MTTPTDVATTVLPPGDLDLDPGDLVESAILLVKVSKADDTSAIHQVHTVGSSHWERIGLLTDALDHQRGLTAWESDR